jgi:hypothetical protein
MKTFRILILVILASCGVQAISQHTHEGVDSSPMDVPRPTDRQVDYSPYPKQDFPNRVFFGDTHLHTSYSTDAGMVGNRLGPEDAFRIARAEVLESSHGAPVHLKRPL